MSSAPSRPPRRMDAPPDLSSMTEAQQFEQSYTEAYKKIDQAITFVTENRHEQVWTMSITIEQLSMSV